jgi:phospholipid/cholesterol/gamma-HCH transport system substrate-binding protein
MDAGEVLDVRIPASPASKFRVRLRINEALRGLVRTDSIVTIYTEGVVGNKFLSIGVGTAQAPAAAPEGRSQVRKQRSFLHCWIKRKER